MKPFILFLILSFSLISSNAQVNYIKEDSLSVLTFLDQIETFSDQKQTGGDRISHIGSMFLDIPYVGKTLEISEPESLVVNLRELDCTTYLENVVSLSTIDNSNGANFEDFLQQLQKIRYRSGELQGYASRLHYFSEWLFDNEQKGIIKNITKDIGGVPYTKKIDFMSTHRNAYKQLKDEELYVQIQEIEDEINTRQMYYIPKGEVAKIAKKLKDGDLIAITTSIKGLDIVHTGFVKYKDGIPHLMHASSDNKRVEVSRLPLHQYLQENKSQSGIMVARIAPKQ